VHVTVVKYPKVTMVGSCMICLGEEGELWSSCLPGTCYNLKIHPRCYSKWLLTAPPLSPLVCPICEKEYAIRVVESTFLCCPYVRSWRMFGVLTVYVVCGCVIVSVITAVALQTTVNYISLCLCGVVVVTLLTLMGVCHTIRKAMGICNAVVYSSVNGRKYYRCTP